MSTFEEQLAAATLAKIFGSELKQVDEFTTHQSSTGPATKIDPTSFLTTVKEVKKQQQNAMIEQQNRLAEQLYPLPTPETYTSPSVPPPIPQPPVTPVVSGEINDTLKSINTNLEKIANLLESKWANA